MSVKIDSVEKVSVTTTAKDINVNYRAFLIENLSETPVYIKEKSEDGKAATTNNGFAITGLCDKIMRAKTLSIIGEGASDVRLLYVIEDE